MSMSKSRASVALAGALAVTALTAAPAMAVDSDSLSCTGGTVRAVKTGDGFGYIRITVRNGCSTQQRVKVYVSNNTDVGCTTYAPGQSRSYRYSWPSDLDRIAFC